MIREADPPGAAGRKTLADGPAARCAKFFLVVPRACRTSNCFCCYGKAGRETARVINPTLPQGGLPILVMIMGSDRKPPC